MDNCSMGRSTVPPTRAVAQVCWRRSMVASVKFYGDYDRKIAFYSSKTRMLAAYSCFEKKFSSATDCMHGRARQSTWQPTSDAQKIMQRTDAWSRFLNPSGGRCYRRELSVSIREASNRPELNLAYGAERISLHILMQNTSGCSLRLKSKASFICSVTSFLSPAWNVD